MSMWPSARAELQQVHRLVHEELAVIPLWQLREYLAYDRRLGGVPARPVALYASLEAWKLEPWSPAP